MNEEVFPKNIRKISFFYGPRFEDGIEIIRDYCKVCKNNSNCEKKKDLSMAMGENYPHWNNSFILVSVEKENTPFYFPREDKHAFCNDYSNIQGKIFNFNDNISEGLEKLIELTRD
jgi:hypothetical protein